jgi:hypothetical protein
VADILTLSRYDLGIALLNGSSPVFYQKPDEPVISYPAQLLSASGDETFFQDNTDLTRQLDDDLVRACQILKRFCSMANFRTQAEQITKPDIIHETMTSVMYRLLHASAAVGVMNNAVRLGLLAFSYHLFIQWQDVKLPYQHFPKAYKECFQSLRVADNVSPRLMLWLLMTAAISLFDITHEAWLRELLREYIGACKVSTWEEMQDILESFMWIALLDRQLGKRIYDELDLGVGEEKA